MTPLDKQAIRRLNDQLLKGLLKTDKPTPSGILSKALLREIKCGETKRKAIRRAFGLDTKDKT